MNYYGKVAGPQHTIYGRVVPMMEAMRLAVLRAAEQPMPAVQLANDVPTWVHRMADEPTRTVFKGIVNIAPATKTYHARKNGQQVGLLLRMVLFYWKEVPAIWEREGMNKLTPEQEARLEKLTGQEAACCHASKIAGHPITTKAELLKFWKRRLFKFSARMAQQTWLLVKYTLHQPVEDIFQFVSGVPEGFKCFLRTDSEFAKRGKRTEIYWALVSYWSEIEEMCQSQPPLTRRYLLEWLEQQEGKQLMDSEKAFQELCDDIDLDMGPPSHPFKISET